MHRWLVIFLLIVLPLQWSWAAAASVCAHETDPTVSHFGHHTHEHTDSDAGVQSEQSDGKMADYHADCGVCHGLGTAFIAAHTSLTTAWPGMGAFARYQEVVPDRSLETLLRPPLGIVS